MYTQKKDIPIVCRNLEDVLCKFILSLHIVFQSLSPALCQSCVVCESTLRRCISVNVNSCNLYIIIVLYHINCSSDLLQLVGITAVLRIDCGIVYREIKVCTPLLYPVLYLLYLRLHKHHLRLYCIPLQICTGYIHAVLLLLALTSYDDGSLFYNGYNAGCTLDKILWKVGGFSFESDKNSPEDFKFKSTSDIFIKIAAENRLYVYDANQKKFLAYMPNFNKLYASYEDKTVHIDTRTRNVIETMMLHRDYSSGHIYCITDDGSGCTWLGTADTIWKSTYSNCVELRDLESGKYTLELRYPT